MDPSRIIFLTLLVALSCSVEGQDPCQSNPCTPPSICANSNGGFLCICQDIQYGDLCELIFFFIDEPPERFNDETGTLLSPNFPNPSPDRIFFDFYIVQVPDARSIEFVFDFFCTDPGKDFLYYGAGNSPSVAAFPISAGVASFNGGQTIDSNTTICDSPVPNSFTIQGDSAWFRYDTDQNIMSLGFNFSYTVDPDDCNLNRCQNGGICDDLFRNYSCMCLPGFEGKDCQINLDECASMPCLNNATDCLDGPNFFFCVCAPGFTGVRCETDIDECASMPCQNGAMCNDFVNMYNCTCLPGFEGVNCENEIDPCLSEPCLNNATCSELPGDTSIPFQCLCVDGFTGDFCEEDIDECASMPCQNNATCNNLLNMYTCDCPDGFEGVNCENATDPCLSDPCQIGATCNTFGDVYNCTCPEGLEGIDCEMAIIPCDSNPCTNNATCFNLPTGFGFFCLCPPGLTGTQCETDIDECASMPCMNFATCVDMVNGYRCDCAPGFEGTTCDINIDQCDPNPCQASSTIRCVDLVDDYDCICQDGFEDRNCSTNINECASDPCQNGATCVDGIALYLCMCPPGFEGVNCENEPNECAIDPCVNGVCNDLIDMYMCNCTGTGFFGTNCESDILECASDPCMNEGTCFEGTLGYACACAPGFTGTNCETDIDECSSDPCQNNATCTDLVNGFNCTCQDGFFGVFCMNDTDECASDPCLNGATCSNRLNAFVCECVPGFNGTNCEINIDECASNPCMNGATCNDMINSFNCTCPPGFTGDICQTMAFPTTLPTTMRKATSTESSLCPRQPVIKEAEGVLTRVEWNTPIVHITDTNQIIELTQKSLMGPGDLFPVGTTEVMFSALGAVCKFHVIVEGDGTASDVTPPKVHDCPEEQLRYTAESYQNIITPVWREPFATDDSCLPVVKQSSHSPGDMFARGETKVTFNFTDSAGNLAQCIFIISVIGKNATEDIPKFSFCPSSIRFFLPDSSDEAGITWDEPKIEGMFAVNKTHSSGDIFKIGTTVVSYTIVNPSGSSALCKFNVDVIDINPPRIFLCPSSKRVRLCRGSTTVFWTEPFSEDNSRLPVRSNQSHHPGLKVLSGTTIVNYTFTDVLNNTSVCSFNITVHHDSCQRGLQELHPIFVNTILGLVILALVILVIINICMYSYVGSTAQKYDINFSLRDINIT